MLRKSVFSFIFILGICETLSAQKEIMGTVTESNGKTFTIICEKCDLLPKSNDTCEVSKDISGNKNPFGIMVQSGWMSVADAFFTGKKGNEATFTIIRETSTIVINGQKREHFVIGKKMKIVWN